MRLLLFLFLLLHLRSVLAQTTQLDSLQTLVKKSTGTQKVDALNALAFEQMQVDIRMADKTIEEALALSNKLNYPTGQARGRIYKGISENYQGNQRKSFITLNEGIRQARSLKLQGLEGYGLTQLGNIYRIAGKYDSSYYWYQQAYRVLKDSLYPPELSVLYRNLSQLYKLRAQPKEQLTYLLKSYEIRKRFNDKVLYTDILILLSQYYSSHSDYKNAIRYIQEAEKIDTVSILPELKIDIQYQKAIILFKQGAFTQALLLLNNITDYYQQTGNLVNYASVTIDLANMLEELGNYDLSTRKCFEALELCKAKNFKNEEIRAMIVLSWNYSASNQLTLALETAQQALAESQQHNFLSEEAAAENILGSVYSKQEQQTNALLHFNRALALRKKLGDALGESHILGNMSTTYMQLKRYQEAISYIERSIVISDSLHDTMILAWNYLRLAKAHIGLNQLGEAETYLKKAEQKTNLNELGKTRDAKRLLLDIYESKKTIRMAQGRDHEALQLYELYEHLKDSLDNTAMADKILSLQAYYQVDKQKQEIQLQQDQIHLQQSEIKKQRIIIAAVVFGLAVLAALLYLAYYSYTKFRKLNRELQERSEEIQAQSEELTESNQLITTLNQNLEAKVQERTQALAQAYQELDTFFYRSSHDFRRPLTTFMGLAEVANIMVKDEVALDLFRKVKETAINLDRMIFKLQSISEVGMEHLTSKRVSLRKAVEDACHHFNVELRETGMKVEIQLPEHLSIETYPSLLKIVLENIIENAIRFRGPVNPTLSITGRAMAEGIELSIVDNGIGIESEYIDRVTDMFFRGSIQSNGNGLGLYLVKKAMEKLNGQFQFSSIYTKGSTVTIVLPPTLENA